MSLPVRIFEKRTLVERMCDYFCTGPTYLRKAALEQDPVERFKAVIAFVVSGLHVAASQRKPFNSIIGETFQGQWPDGTKLYLESTGHTPPMLSFLVEHVDQLYTYEGTFVFTGKMASLGNALVGRQGGKNRVHFRDGTVIEFEYPFLKMGGILYGKRTLQWIEALEFRDARNGLRAKLEFSQGPGVVYGGNSLPIDCFEGHISNDGGYKICKVQGSWLEFLRFNE